MHPQVKGDEKPTAALLRERPAANLEQKRFASMVRMLRTAYPKNWETHLANLGLTASANPPPADLDRIMEHVFWMVRQAGIKNPAAWIKFDMDRAEFASASVEPESLPKVVVRQTPVELKSVKPGMGVAKTSGASLASSKVASALVEPLRQDRAELKPVRPGTDLAKASRASPSALETVIKEPAARIPSDMARVNAASTSVKSETSPKVARRGPPKPADVEPVNLGVDSAKSPDASQLDLETAIFIDRLLSQAKLAMEAGRRQEAADAMFTSGKYGATQQKIGAGVGMSQSWVSNMIRWRREGFKDDTPFGPGSKDGRMWAGFRRTTGFRMPKKILMSRYRKLQTNLTPNVQRASEGRSTSLALLPESPIDQCRGLRRHDRIK
jgi:hypothetical protein